MTNSTHGALRLLDTLRKMHTPQTVRRRNAPHSGGRAKRDTWRPESVHCPLTPSCAVHLDLPPVGACRSLNRSSQIVAHRLTVLRGDSERGSVKVMLSGVGARRSPHRRRGRIPTHPHLTGLCRAHLFFCAAAEAAASNRRPTVAQASPALTIGAAAGLQTSLRAPGRRGDGLDG